MAGERCILANSVLFLSFAALAATFQSCPFFLHSAMLLLHDFDAFDEEFFTVKVECGDVRKVCKCNMNLSRGYPTLRRLQAKMRPGEPA